MLNSFNKLDLNKATATDKATALQTDLKVAVSGINTADKAIEKIKNELGATKENKTSFGATIAYISFVASFHDVAEKLQSQVKENSDYKAAKLPWSQGKRTYEELNNGLSISGKDKWTIKELSCPTISKENIPDIAAGLANFTIPALQKAISEHMKAIKDQQAEQAEQAAIEQDQTKALIELALSKSNPDNLTVVDVLDHGNKATSLVRMAQLIEQGQGLFEVAEQEKEQAAIAETAYDAVKALLSSDNKQAIADITALLSSHERALMDQKAATGKVLRNTKKQGEKVAA
ncbi:hypothetical protein [Kiloniella sp.]|uniref:hypothetical protein n=1 Tax=Kiloniella sp. TaxID=1938587 RepID=UPI003B01AA25